MLVLLELVDEKPGSRTFSRTSKKKAVQLALHGFKFKSAAGQASR
jgi:hypothetical protein